MDIRRVLKFNGTLGMTLPNRLSRVLDLHWKDYVEIYLADGETLLIRKHPVTELKMDEHGPIES